eukprot:m.279416 g.279416  ORF g.279416 m.279416 type:complete len:59 (+) comp15743_c0_seq1:193-369(+)
MSSIYYAVVWWSDVSTTSFSTPMQRNQSFVCIQPVIAPTSPYTAFRHNPEATGCLSAI